MRILRLGWGDPCVAGVRLILNRLSKIVNDAMIKVRLG